MIFNQGNTATPTARHPGRDAHANNTSGIPVLGTTYALGVTLASTPGCGCGSSRTRSPDPADVNVIAEKTGANDDNVVMAGAHLDSVLAGPGINDNGSGSAAILEAAEQIANIKPQNTIRFAWWGAEESGLVGSTDYVNGLSQAEKDRIALYLNFDMVGSPNYIFMVYDGDQSSFPAPVGVPPARQRSRTFRVLLHDAAASRTTTPSSVDAATTRPFIVNGIPAGGLFTGAEGIKTAEQAAIWGGTAGQQFDPCYHAACDTFANNNDHALEVNADSVAFAILTYAYSTESVNGVPGKRSRQLPDPGPGRPGRHVRSVSSICSSATRGRPGGRPLAVLRAFSVGRSGWQDAAMDVLLRVDAGPGAEPAETAEPPSVCAPSSRSKRSTPSRSRPSAPEGGRARVSNLAPCSSSLPRRAAC